MRIANLDSIHYRRVIQLSHTIHSDIPLWEGDPIVQFNDVATIEHDGYHLRQFTIGEHSATHMNAPSSFFDDGQGIDSYSPETLIHPIIVIDVSEKVKTDPNYVISLDDIQIWEQQYGAILTGTLALFYTGWQHRWHTPKDFLNIDSTGIANFPGIGEQTTHFLLTKRHITGIGIDTHGVDPGKDITYATNKQILSQHGIVLECLTNLDQLPAKGATLVIGILSLHQGSGSPVSAMAFIN
ncbi:MAG: Isatin hydrolase [Candidatus Celerinatantimonas neptuna]|nr:MAG: Isatin hydrolase [Candidatus Celerinatantimonas neptuna]